MEKYMEQSKQFDFFGLNWRLNLRWQQTLDHIHIFVHFWSHLLNCRLNFAYFRLKHCFQLMHFIFSLLDCFVCRFFSQNSRPEKFLMYTTIVSSHLASYLIASGNLSSSCLNNPIDLNQLWIRWFFILWNMFGDISFRMLSEEKLKG